MPKEAIRLGAADQVVPITRVAAAITSQLDRASVS
jgi:chemotaxis response regulator CheB